MDIVELEDRLDNNNDVSITHKSNYVKRILNIITTTVYTSDEISQWPGILIPTFFGRLFVRMCGDDDDGSDSSSGGGGGGRGRKWSYHHRQLLLHTLYTTLTTIDTYTTFSGQLWLLWCFNVRGLHLLLPRILTGRCSECYEILISVCVGVSVGVV